MAEFDPNKPFDIVEKGGFDPNKPFDIVKKKVSSENGGTISEATSNGQLVSSAPETIPQSGFVTIASRSQKPKGVYQEKYLSPEDQRKQVEETIGKPKVKEETTGKFEIVKEPSAFKTPTEKLAEVDLAIPKEKPVISDDNQYSAIINNPDKTAEEFEAAVEYSIFKTRELQQQLRDEEKQRAISSEDKKISGKEGFERDNQSVAVNIPQEGITPDVMNIDQDIHVGSLEYITSKAYNESTIGLADAMLNRQYRIDPELLGKYSPNWIEDATASTMSLLMDAPLFIASGGVGTVAVRQAGKLAAKSLVEKGIEKQLANELVGSGMKKAAGRFLSGSLQTGTTLGTFGFTKDAMTQLADPEVSFSDWDYGQSLNRFGKDFTLGLTVGGVSTGFKFVSDFASSIESNAGRVATQLALRPTALATENAVFVYGGSVLEGKDIKDVTSQEFIAGAITLFGAGAIGAKESARNLVKSLGFKPEKAGNGEFKVDFSNDDLKSLGVQSNEEAVRLGQDISVLPDILKNETIPALTKAKLLYTSHGIKMEGDLLADNIQYVGENTIEIRNKEGILLDRTEYSSQQDARNEGLLLTKKIEERKWRDETAKLPPNMVSDIQADLMTDKKFNFEELNNALDVPLDKRTMDQNLIVNRLKEKVTEYKEKEAKDAITSRKEESKPEYQRTDAGLPEVREDRIIPPEEQVRSSEAGSRDSLQQGEGKVAEVKDVDPIIVADKLSRSKDIFEDVKSNKITLDEFLEKATITEREKSLVKDAMDKLVPKMSEEVLERELKKMAKDCYPELIAKDGTVAKFKAGGKWELVENIEGESHKEGGVDVEIKGNDIKAEGKEIIIKNEFGTESIVPKKYAEEVKGMLKDGCFKCIDDLVSNLPEMPEYAQDGAVITDGSDTEQATDLVKSAVDKKNEPKSVHVRYASVDKSTGERKRLWPLRNTVDLKGRTDIFEIGRDRFNTPIMGTHTDPNSDPGLKYAYENIGKAMLYYNKRTGTRQIVLNDEALYKFME